VSLPGGTRERQDTGDIMTALREAEEEVGLRPEAVEIIGQLGRILLPSGFEVTPVVGLVDPDPILLPCPVEVDEIFMAPTSLLLDPDSYEESMMEFQGVHRRILEVYHGGFRIWGATASILHHLATRLRDADADLMTGA
jgi:8-oxo-dGTP pyrophosphatase MutT (NUDIX family)